MGFIYGTESNDRILRGFLSDGVMTDPPDLTGTEPGHFNDIIYGYGGNDLIVLGTQSDIVDGGTGNDVIDARQAGRPGFFLVLSGGPGNDVIFGTDRLDVLDGNYQGIVTDPAAGNDVLIGGKGDDRYFVDSVGDVVIERRDEGHDRIYTELKHYALKANFEELFLSSEDAVGVGNAADNYLDAGPGGRLFGMRGDDVLFSYDGAVLHGGHGNDAVLAYLGENLLFGGKGDDWLEIFDSIDDSGKFLQFSDQLRGRDGDDTLFGAAGGDFLIGGRGTDVFGYYYLTDSDGKKTDVIQGGDQAKAFDGAGAAAGDLIMMPQYAGQDADFNLIELDFDTYVFGGTGKGHISLVDRGRDTVVRLNADDDPDFDFLITIQDGKTKAAQYTIDDFILPF